MTTPLTIIYAHPAGQGWATVTLLARLAARLLDADLIEVPRKRPYSRLRAATAALPRRRGRGHALVIAANPGDLLALATPRHWLAGYAHVSGYVIDSFWDDRIPRLARGRGHFDQLFITDAELVDDWQQTTGTPTHWLPFGTDALSVRDVTGPRPVDLQRIGRQPAPWEDDARVATLCAERGLSFGGRPPFADDPVANQANLAAALRRAKFTLSFSNRVSPAPYTHPTREYLTGRWLDALANGASVAGIAPRCRATDELLWPEALVTLPDTTPEAGLPVIVDAIHRWRPEDPARNQLRSLERLDWRWRLRTIAEVTNRPAPALDADIRVLESRIAALSEAT